MKNTVLTKLGVLALAIIMISVFALQVSAAVYICTPTSFNAVYNTTTETVTYSGTYTGTIQSTRMYMITLVDAKNRTISIRNPMGSELDSGNKRFKYSFYLEDTALTDYTQPFKATISCVQASIIQPTTTTVTVTDSAVASFNVSFAAGANGTIAASSATTVEEGTLVADISFPTPKANDGYEFDKWVASEGGVADGAIVADVVFTAQFKKTVVLGDVNDDGYADNLDAAKILRFDAGILSEINEEAADVNKSGSVDNLDAALVLKYDCGLIEGF